MRQVVYALTGSEGAPPILDRLLARFVERVRDDFEDIVWSMGFRTSPLAQPIYESFDSLSDKGKLGICLDPVFFDALCAVVRDSGESQLQHLQNVIDGGLRASAHDDRALPTTIVGETITVDFGSHYCRRIDPTSPVFMAKLDPHTDAERRTVEIKIAAAIAEIDETAPAFARLIRNYTRTIFVRKIENHVPASEQVDTELGAIRLRNVHSDIYSHDQLVDDLVHESTHNFLGTFEYLYFPFNPYGHRADSWVRPVSPWSMRSIQVLPFIHACFVYFSMFHYCERRRQSGKATTDEFKRLISRQNRYASGFLMPGHLSDYVASLAPTDPRVCQAIDWMEEIMNDRYRLSSGDRTGATLSAIAA